MTLPHSTPRLAFVDLETTGATASTDRITEIGIVTVDGDSVSEWSSLVNPGLSIPPFIQSLTGISNEMVATAPTFEELADEIAQRLDGCLFIAHNARFDHGFLKNAFKRSGHAFRPTVLCTVKLSRKLFPQHARHNLDTLMQRHQLESAERHRALGDARLIWQFWQVIHQTLAPALLQAAIAELTARPSWPSQLDESVLDTLPGSHGVYLFYGDNDLPLYIGKANNLRKRVLSHFSNDHVSSKELNLSQQLRRIDWRQTAGELGALLQEAALIKSLAPSHNRRLRRNESVCAWRGVLRDGCLQLALVTHDDLFFAQDSYLFGPFISSRKATEALRFVIDEHQLCAALLGLEKIAPGAPCFASQIKRCHGACTGMENIAAHSQRALQALMSYQLTAWPYSGPIAIREGAELHVVDNWGFGGTVASIEAAQTLLQDTRIHFDRDVYQILKRHLPLMQNRIVELGLVAGADTLRSQPMKKRRRSSQ